MESSPAQNSGKCKAQEHRIQKNKSRDGSVGVFAENHEGNEPHSRSLKVQFASGKVGHGNADRAKEGVECSHEGIVDLIWVFLARLEFERTIVSCQISGQSDEHFSERGVDIEVEFALEVMGTEFTKTIHLPLVNCQGKAERKGNSY